jgi:oxygen-independent coproporphyrinogen III oxidase
MNYSLYLHIPFCNHRCHYCDFITFTGKTTLIPSYFNYLENELRIVAGNMSEKRVHSVYFGGGTPSLVQLSLFTKLFSTIRSEFSLTANCEISLEANPGTVTVEYLMGLRELGLNRISFGVQSTDSFDLVRLDRNHGIEDVLSAVHHARVAGFDNISLDMIFGLPWQNLESWENSLTRAIALAPEHFSLYSLIIEPDTPLFEWYQKGLIASQDQDLEGEMYERAIELLDQAGYEQYEISNWARRDHNVDYRCRHNLQYWLNLPYLGFGAGSHGYAGGVRTVNASTIDDYCHRICQKTPFELGFPSSPATVSTTDIDKNIQMKDFMMLGFRLVREGVSKERFSNMFGCEMMDVFKSEITRLLINGLIEWDEGGKTRLQLTKRGVMVANQVFMAFV